MSRCRIRGLAAAGAFALAAVTSGCGLGEGEPSQGAATLTITRDYGAQRLAEATEAEPADSDTVIRMLDREAEIETRYSGGFVQSIDGIEGEIDAGRSFDWFFFVNGIESSTGAAEVEIRGGDRVWWDYRDWTDALRTPAVVGSWPEPFLQASAERERIEVRVECFGSRDPCERVRDRLAGEAVNASVETPRRRRRPFAAAARWTMVPGALGSARGQPRPRTPGERCVRALRRATGRWLEPRAARRAGVGGATASRRRRPGRRDARR